MSSLTISKDNHGGRPHPNAITTASRILYFIGMNPPTFYGSKVDKDQQFFIDKVLKVVDVMCVTLRDRMEIVPYRI